MTCSECSSDLRIGTKFCVKCGNRIKDSVQLPDKSQYSSVAKLPNQPVNVDSGNRIEPSSQCSQGMSASIVDVINPRQPSKQNRKSIVGKFVIALICIGVLLFYVYATKQTSQSYSSAIRIQDSDTVTQEVDYFNYKKYVLNGHWAISGDPCDIHNEYSIVFDDKVGLNTKVNIYGTFPSERTSDITTITRYSHFSPEGFDLEVFFLKTLPVTKEKILMQKGAFNISRRLQDLYLSGEITVLDGGGNSYTHKDVSYYVHGCINDYASQGKSLAVDSHSPDSTLSPDTSATDGRSTDNTPASSIEKHE